MASELDYELMNIKGIPKENEKKETERNYFLTNENGEYSLRSPLSGRLLKIYPKRGSRVKGEEIVAEIECMKTIVYLKVPRGIKEGEVVSIKENVENGKGCYVRQNEELMRIRVKF
jgi:biotin carboxyl carrier protein